jgi:hypothetical protein
MFHDSIDSKVSFKMDNASFTSVEVMLSAGKNRTTRIPEGMVSIPRA